MKGMAIKLFNSNSERTCSVDVEISCFKGCVLFVDSQRSVLASGIIGSVSSRECLDAPAILATFTAGRTGLVACP